MQIRHVIATRLGIGVARPTFYRRHIAHMAATTLPSLAAQTRTDFEWVVAVDRFIDAESEAGLTRLFEPFPHFHIRKVNPFTEGLSPGLETVLPDRRAGDDMVVVSRLDDDDAVSVDFVETMADTLQAHPIGRYSIAFTTGFMVDPASRRFCGSQKKAIAIGLSVAAPADDPLNAYLCNHRKIHDHLREIGGDNIVTRTEKPMWLHVRNSGSVSNELGDGIVMPETARSMDSARDVQKILDPTLARFALGSGWMSDIVQVWNDTPDPAPPIVGDERLRRLAIKRELLRVHRNLAAKGRSTAGIENAFYMV